jgi:hypothetical protein
MDIEARIAAAHADRKARGLLVRWLHPDGRECSESCANEEQKAALLADLARRGRQVMQ